MLMVNKVIVLDGSAYLKKSFLKNLKIKSSKRAPKIEGRSPQILKFFCTLKPSKDNK